MNKQAGFTLVELIIFIILIGLASVTLLATMQNVSQRLPTSSRQIMVIMVAQERMDLITGQEFHFGYDNLIDPCTTNPSIAICIAPSGYTVNSNITTTNFNNDSNYKIITVTAIHTTNNAKAVLTMMVGS